MLNDTDVTWLYEPFIFSNGSQIEYAVLLPPNYDPNRPTRLMLALPPGPQTRAMVEAGLGMWQRAALYGMVVISPIAPEGNPYYRNGFTLIPELVEHLHENYNIDGQIDLAGISNGGISSFHTALARPDLYRSMIVVPGVAPKDAPLERLREIKIRMHVGSEDGGWVDSMRVTADQLEVLAHPDFTLTVYEGIGHIVTPLQGDGIDPIIESILQN